MRTNLKGAHVPGGNLVETVFDCVISRIDKGSLGACHCDWRMCCNLRNRSRCCLGNQSKTNFFCQCNRLGDQLFLVGQNAANKSHTKSFFGVKKSSCERKFTNKPLKSLSFIHPREIRKIYRPRCQQSWAIAAMYQHRGHE